MGKQEGPETVPPAPFTLDPSNYRGGREGTPAPPHPPGLTVSLQSVVCLLARLSLLSRLRSGCSDCRSRCTPLFPTTAPGACFCLAHLTLSGELSTLKIRFYTYSHISALARKPDRRPPLGSKPGGDDPGTPSSRYPQPRFVLPLSFPVF